MMDKDTITLCFIIGGFVLSFGTLIGMYVWENFQNRKIAKRIVDNIWGRK